MTQHYLASNIIMENTIIVRNRVLPPHVYGTIAVDVDDEVTGNHVVAQGQSPQDYVIIDVAEALGISPARMEKQKTVMAVEAGERVEAGQPLAIARRRRDRKRMPKAPAAGIVNLVENGRVILQINPKPVLVRARIPGIVEDMVGERGVRIRSTGTLIQCAWGNGKFGFGPYHMEPETGLASLAEQNTMLSSIRGRVYVLNRPITGDDLRIVAEQELGGLVGPSMPFYLREASFALKVPVILTEGFGDLRPARRTYEMLKKYAREREGAFDAAMPSRWEYGRPEIVLPGGSTLAKPPAIDRPLKVGDAVRVRVGKLAGEIGEVLFLPPTPTRVENGLRLPSAQLKIRNMPDKITIPLANLEIMGDSK